MERATALADRVHGTVVFVGATDTGKTTLAQRVLEELESRGRRVAYLDCDVGQTTIGPPATLGVRWRAPDGDHRTRLYFVGGTSPRGHFLPVIVGASVLVRKAYGAGVDTVLVDTSGLIDPAAGGVALKLWKCEALGAEFLVALQRETELRPILRGVRRRLGEQVVVLNPEPGARTRERRERSEHRRERWAQHFASAHEAELRPASLDLWGGGCLESGRILGLDGADGLCLALGVVTKVQPRAVRALTPLPDVRSVQRVRVGDIRLDRDWREMH